MADRATDRVDMSRTTMARLTQHLIDVAVLALAYAGAYMVRFEGAPPSAERSRLLISLPIAVAVQMLALRSSQVHRIAWRYVGLRDIRQILSAVTVATLVLVCIRAVVGADWMAAVRAHTHWTFANHLYGPIGVLIADGVFAFCGIVGVRALRRLDSERGEARRRRLDSSASVIPTLLAGAGRAGALVAREIAGRPDLGIKAVGFVDDDPAKLGTQIAGLPVLGATGDIERVALEFGARQVLISMASAPGQAIRDVTRLCQAARLPVKIIPGVFEIINGKAALNRIRDVAIEDLLRREPVDLDTDAISEFLRDRVVLVTGAGGSIGSEVCRQVARFQPRKLVLVERAETSLFFIERELRETFPKLSVVPCIADVCDDARVEQVFAAHRPHTVFHAAAHKHVPMMEHNPGEAVKNNVFGTMVVADAADRFRASEFVLISTDKAVRPVSVMGATKRASELYVQALSSRSETRFVAVRFGNVLGSAGSVVPIFREQIRKGGPVTITHPDMRRYFMTIPEATQLVLQAAAVGESGEILILDMGEPVKLVDLARDLIRLSGLREGDDIDVVFTGIRPGERLFEELYGEDELADRSRHQRVFVARSEPSGYADVSSGVARLRAILERNDDTLVRDGLRQLVPEFRPQAPETRLESPSPPPHPIEQPE
jgi:FlaA1/EpsC-like NDP-sugar epimerase